MRIYGTFALLVLLLLLAWAWLATLPQIPSEPKDQLDESIEFNVSEGERSSRWTEVRNNFVKSHPVCEACGGSVALNVHHVEPFHEREDLELV